MADEPALRYSVRPNGERVIPASRRADGSWRKERRVKEGYLPQEEQPLYTTKVVLARREVPLCPGLSEEAVKSAEQRPQKSKTAKRNERRKEKRQEKRLQDSLADSDKAGEGVSSISEVTEEMENMRITSTSQEGTAGEGDGQDTQTAKLKRLRALKKKLRECEALLKKQQEGAALVGQEKAKLEKIDSWQQEMHALEQETDYQQRCRRLFEEPFETFS